MALQNTHLHSNSVSLERLQRFTFFLLMESFCSPKKPNESDGDLHQDTQPTKPEGKKQSSPRYCMYEETLRLKKYGKMCSHFFVDLLCHNKISNTVIYLKTSIYIDAVNDQRTIQKSLYSMRAQQSVSIPEPLEHWAGVSVDGTVQYGRASLDNNLRHVSFSLQHWRFCRDNHSLSDQKTWGNPPEQAWSTRLPLTRTNDSARMEPTLFSAMHTYVPASLLVTLSMLTELLPASSTVAPGTSERLRPSD